MITCPALAQQEIKNAEASGKKLTPDQLATLILLSWRVENPKTTSLLFVNVFPVKLCDEVLLWPVTLQAAFWHKTTAGWWHDTSEEIAAFAYALCHGRTAGHFDGLTDCETAREAVLSWRESLPVTLEELSAAILCICRDAAFTQEVKPKPGAKRGDDWPEILADLVAMTGQPIEYWLAHTSEFAMTVLDRCYRSRVLAAGGKWKHDTAYESAMRDFVIAATKIREQLQNG